VLSGDVLVEEVADELADELAVAAAGDGADEPAADVVAGHGSSSQKHGFDIQQSVHVTVGRAGGVCSSVQRAWMTSSSSHWHESPGLMWFSQAPQVEW
jgi:hypothetical protein